MERRETVRALPDDVKPYLAANHLHLIVMPTEQCNFRCTYCYESHSGLGMSKPVVVALKRFLRQRAKDLDQLTLAWFGGEPLLAADVVEEVQEHVRRLSRENSRLACHSSIVTNGFHLDRERFSRLLELGIRQYQVTFDGPRDLHDERRVRAGGQGTFDRIWRNLETLRDVEGDFEILVRLHVDRDNRESMDRFLVPFRDTFGSDTRFALFIRPVSRFGSPNDADLPVLEGREALSALEAVRGQASGMGLRHSAIESSKPVCYAARANSFVIRSDGSLCKCTVALDHPANRVGRLLDDGRVEIDADKMKPWMRGLFSGDEDERGCPMHGCCMPVPSNSRPTDGSN